MLLSIRMLPMRDRLRPALGAALLLAVALLLPTAAARADVPDAALKLTVDEGLRILQDPGYRAEGQRVPQHRRLCEVVYRDFDFAEFSKRVLADQWARFSADQRVEFVEVFARFLAEHYMERLQERYTNEAVAVRGAEPVAPGRAVVKTGVTWRGREFPVEVRMHLREGRWKAYDVSLLGISAVQIYRAQFQAILRTHSPAQVIALVRSRLDEQ
jgi:phospholipid transport system substrate-binding protein